MSEKYVSVADFHEPVAAEIARGKLESEGIPVVLTGGMAANTFSAIGNLGGRIELRVPAEQVAQAVQLLAEGGDADHLTEVAREEASEGPMWVCALCGDVVRGVLPLCPACHTPRGKVPDYNPDDDADEPEEGIQTGPIQAIQRTEKLVTHAVKPSDDMHSEQLTTEPEIRKTSNVEAASSATTEGDALAKRAFLATIFGPPTAGLLTVYACWLLLRLGFSGDELSTRGKRFLFLAFLTNASILLIMFLICSGSL
jgi:hypothetical protein